MNSQGLVLVQSQKGECEANKAKDTEGKKLNISLNLNILYKIPKVRKL